MKILYTTIFLLFTIQVCTAQDPKSLESLKAPSMPAATIINTQVNEISSPKSLKALETALLNNFMGSNKNIIIPNDYALELNPFYLTPRKNFNYLSYLEDSCFSGRIMWRNLSLSVASTTNFLIKDSVGVNALGFGARTIILNGKVSPAAKAAYIAADKNLNQAHQANALIRNSINNFLDNTASVYSIANVRAYILSQSYIDSDITASAVNQIFDAVPADTKENQIKPVVDSIQKVLNLEKSAAAFNAQLQNIKTDRYGWRMDVNLAYALSFPTNEFDFSISPRWGLWGNLSYKPLKNLKDANKNITGKEPSDFEFIALGRVIRNNSDFVNRYSPMDTSFRMGNSYDFGLRAVYEYKKFSIALEYIYRLNRNTITRNFEGDTYSKDVDSHTEKYVLNINYKISDNTILSYNIGKNYDNVAGINGNLISGLTLNLGFGDMKVQDLYKKAQQEKLGL